ncbi:nucleoside triphosphate pyrophosphohydrolase [Nocardia sp. NEAU-351]|uniref:Nucleoside triphosphate pyrophosphohydrolase n=1 Tax=Nocardia bovistercoris TaxID=2785916 RepID=A0A931I6X9_9NOCA|nr:nucleoside triphosphate pyrophosphohydrolase [Nocardia bovistercoris]
MGKLVRDGIPGIIRASGGTPGVRVLDADEYEVALHEKMVEEVEELRAACTREERLEEAADVLEVLTAVASYYGFTLEDVRDAAAVKAAERGAFAGRLWLEMH